MVPQNPSPKENQSAITRRENECSADKNNCLYAPGQLQYIVSLLVFVHFQCLRQLAPLSSAGLVRVLPNISPTSASCYIHSLPLLAIYLVHMDKKEELSES